MQGQWARLAHKGWCAGVVPAAPCSLKRTRREITQAESPTRGGAARATLGLYVVFGFSLLLSHGAARVQGGGSPISIDQRPKPWKEGQTESRKLPLCHCPSCQRLSPIIERGAVPAGIGSELAVYLPKNKAIHTNAMTPP